MTSKIVWTVLAAAWLGTASALAGPAEDHITKGSQYVKTQDYKKAVKEFEAAIAADPKNAKAHLLLGLTLSTTGDLDNALKYTLTAVQLDPAFAGYNNLGLIYANRGLFDKAQEAYEKALALNPKAYRTWYQYGQIQRANGNFQKAIDAYTRSIETNPNFADAYLGLGSAYYWSGHQEKSLEQVEVLKPIDAVKSQALKEWVEGMNAKKSQLKPPVVAAASESSSRSN